MNKNYFKIKNIVILVILFFVSQLYGQTKQDNALEDAIKGLKFREIGPALMSGRIADIAIDPTNPATWYVAVGSGGLWKTTNAGSTWQSIFDDYPSFSLGCVSIDPSNAASVWVGTGENVGGRHVGVGDGIYMSQDGGKSFNHMGLAKSEHISKIVIHPHNSNVIWVAAQGPLWSKGGDRGLYKSENGGKTWKQVLGDNEWVGATDIVIDPINADILY
ncbi:MAG TPA: glycosyl hydrolase, partial [Saprospiraceae bacterium]|nr:glycosyl hydrolase [Saprospiraceae bacterium]